MSQPTSLLDLPDDLLRLIARLVNAESVTAIHALSLTCRLLGYHARNANYRVLHLSTNHERLVDLIDFLANHQRAFARRTHDIHLTGIIKDGLPPLLDYISLATFCSLFRRLQRISLSCFVWSSYIAPREVNLIPYPQRIPLRIKLSDIHPFSVDDNPYDVYATVSPLKTVTIICPQSYSPPAWSPRHCKYNNLVVPTVVVVCNSLTVPRHLLPCFVGVQHLRLYHVNNHYVQWMKDTVTRNRLTVHSMALSISLGCFHADLLSSLRQTSLTSFTWVSQVLYYPDNPAAPFWLGLDILDCLPDTVEHFHIHFELSAACEIPTNDADEVADRVRSLPWERFREALHTTLPHATLHLQISNYGPPWWALCEEIVQRYLAQLAHVQWTEVKIKNIQ